MQWSQTLSVISTTDWEKNHWSYETSPHFEFGPASQDPLSFCQIQLALDVPPSLRPLVGTRRTVRKK
jgi:hypothetical protein